MEPKKRAVSRDDAARAVCDLLERRTALSRDELSARFVAKALGQTTGFLYHHWGSFDAFLLEVSGIGWQRLVAAVVAAYERDPTPLSIPRAYVAFAAAHPVLYWLCAERPLPAAPVREALETGRALPSFAAWTAFAELLERAAPGTTLAQARALHAAAHGLASQLLSGRLASMPDAVGRGQEAIVDDVCRAIASAHFAHVTR